MRLAWETLRHRRAAFVGALVALFTASALVGACGLLLQTGIAGTVAVERYAGAPVVVAADQSAHRVTVRQHHGRTRVRDRAKADAGRVWLDAGAVRRLAGLPGVRAAVPEVDFPAAVATSTGRGGFAAGPDGTSSLGHGWGSAALAPFRLTAGHAPAGGGEIAVDAGLAGRAGLHLGQTVRVQSGGALGSYRVAGLVRAPGKDGLRRQAAVFFSDAEAARLAGHPGQVAAVGLLADPGTGASRLADEARAALAGTAARVHTGDGRGAVEFPDASTARTRLTSMSGAIGGTALFAAILVVVGTFALTVRQRARELALLRAVGTTPRQLRRMVGREALLVGLAAAIPGAAVALPLAMWIHDRFVALGVVPDTLRLALGPIPLAAAVVATVAGGWLAARIAVRRPARVRPGEALAEAAADGRPFGAVRLVAGLVLLAGGLVLVVVERGLRELAGAEPVGYATVLVLAASVYVLGPVVAWAAAAVLGGPLGASRVAGYLAANNARAAAGRFGAVLGPLCLLVAIACTTLFMGSTLDHAASAQAASGTRADWAVASAAKGVGVPDAAVARLRSVPGVTAVVPVRSTRVLVPDGEHLEHYSAVGLGTAGLTRAVDLGVQRGSAAALRESGTVALSRPAADGLGRAARVGSLLPVTLADGTAVRVKVVAVYGRSLGFGDMVLGGGLVAAHADDRAASMVLVAGGREPAVASAARGGGAPAPRVAAAPEAMASAVTGSGSGGGAANWVIAGLIVAFTAIGAVNALAMATMDRTGEFRLLRLTGLTVRQVRGMLRWEAVVVAAGAVLVGVAAAGAVLSAFASGMTGSAVPTVRWLSLGGVAGAALALAIGAVAVSGRAAVRRGAVSPR
ncbi:hypothetical protein BIV57_16835 [Mangrovactinospora gilvigrisea]|uniref:ABC3 transporter permease C-terminal domain-containing protein n=1 Tax=Mangrovactinospora gilvigrisea TaxID=1428644 RepID=A0A1J7BC91_9ACTN|nr:ABC transporter permease [Mangrovactinospora gilvigrisea]OIV36311.1 hypothetical protein BIV57_16835 [Mangrovactinospora gilvigrisea]